MENLFGLCYDIESSIPVDSILAVRPIFCVEGDVEVYKKQIEKIGKGYIIVAIKSEYIDPDMF